MDLSNIQQTAMTREEALKHVAQLRAEVEEVRSRLAGDERESKCRVNLDAHRLMEKSVETIAGQAGTVVGTSIAMARRLFKRRSA
jgi:hypothetical protein